MTSTRLARLLLTIAALAGVAAAARPLQPADPPWQRFLVAAGADRRPAETALREIAAQWRDGYAAIFIDAARLLPSPRQMRSTDERVAVPDDDAGERRRMGTFPERGDLASSTPLPPGAEIRRRLTDFLERRTGKQFGDDLRFWRRWLWSIPYAPHPDYASLKAEIYAAIDPRFRSFFPPRVAATIRLDEIDWGGVRVNGIPPLRSPKTTTASDATWLSDDHVVFGLVVNGEARAYPKRVLAWHELATDHLGKVDLTIVYCTLCGTVVPYESRAGDRRFTFGTSGLLYRSNKLMFDEETSSLWSSLDGRPVVGPLAQSGLRLRMHPVVTTSWGEWKRDHPTTTVLSVNTGFERDYSEGAAYRDYFATDRLMFEVPVIDRRLKNKAEVVVVRSEHIGRGAKPVAISVDRLRRDRIYAFDAGGRGFLVVTTDGGGNLVYERGVHAFEPRIAGRRLRSRDGRTWTLTADALVSETGETLARVPTHRAFWFGWVAQHPDTVLIK